MADETPPAVVPKSQFWRYLGAALVTFGLIATVVALRAEARAFADALANAAAAWLALGFAFTLFASILGYVAFRRVFDAAATDHSVGGRLLSLYFLGQLLRHLPGRYLGVVFQVSQTRAEVSVGAWIAVNAAHSVAIALAGVGVSVAVLLSANLAIALAWIAGGNVVASMVLVRTNWPVRAADTLAGAGWAPIRAIGGPIANMVRTDRAALAGCLAWATASWLAYLGAWACYGVSFPGLGAADGVRLSAYYALAWFVGFATLVAPSGWGVRELTFLAVASEFPGSVLAFGLVVGRVSLLANDLVLGGLLVMRARWKDALTRRASAK